MAYFGPSLGSIFDFGEEGWGGGGGGFASRLVLEQLLDKIDRGH